VVLNPLQPN